MRFHRFAELDPPAKAFPYCGEEKDGGWRELNDKKKA